MVETFYLLGTFYLITMLLVSQFIKRPTKEKQEGLVQNSKQAKTSDLTKGVEANVALKHVEFYILWFILFINIACCFGLISVVAPMAQEMANMSATSAAVVVVLMGIFNGFGRLLLATLSDYIGRPLTFLLSIF